MTDDAAHVRAAFRELAELKRRLQQAHEDGHPDTWATARAAAMINALLAAALMGRQEQHPCAGRVAHAR